jgi:ABC-type microcin C transport system permease subunit YejE
MAAQPRKSEAFFDIVWRQFCKNGPSLVSLYLLAPLFLLAIFAPVLASDQPLVVRQGDSAIYPWFRAVHGRQSGRSIVQYGARRLLSVAGPGAGDKRDSQAA